MQSSDDAPTAKGEPLVTKRAASPTPLCVSSSTHEAHDSSYLSQPLSSKRQRTFNEHQSPGIQNTPTEIPSNICHLTQNGEFEMAGEMRKFDHKAPNLRLNPERMTMIATTLISAPKKDSYIEIVATNQRPGECQSLILDGIEMKGTIEDPVGAVDAPERKAQHYLQEHLPVHVPSQPLDLIMMRRNEVLKSRSGTDKDLVAPQRSLSNYSIRDSKIHSFYTKASILSPRGLSDFKRVQVDERSSFNLLPWSVAMDLNLTLYSNEVLKITISDRLIQTNHYCRFTIRVAGVGTAIRAGVISGLQTIVLGQEWIQSVNLLSGYEDQAYYIALPLAVEATEQRSLGDDSAGLKAQDDGTIEKYHNDECHDVDCGDGGSPNSELTSSVLSPYDDDATLSDGEISPSEESTLDGYELITTNEDDEGYEYDDGDEDGEGYEIDECYKDGEDYGEDEGYVDGEDSEEDEGYEDDKVYEEDDGYGDDVVYEDDEIKKDYRDYREYVGNGHEEGDENVNANLQALMEQRQYHEYYANPTSLDNLRNESIGDSTVNIGKQGLNSEGDEAFPGSRVIDNLKQSPAPSPTKSHDNRVQTLITNLQAKEIAKTLKHISQTQAGQSFKAPVEQLWPECMDVYSAKALNPIDLGTMETKVKNDMYRSLDDIRTDTILLYENSVIFNGVDHIITSAALEVKDTVFEAISDIEEGKGSKSYRASSRKLKGVER